MRSLAKLNVPMCYFAGLLCAYAALILLAPHPPLLQDYPTWVYEGVAVTHILQGHPDLQFSLKHFAVPNSLSDVCLGLLGLVMPWVVAAELWLCVYLAGSFVACRQLVRALPGRSSEVYWLAPSLIVVNLCFWWGFLNFQFSVALMLWFCAVLLRDQAPRTGKLAGLLILIFLCHAISFAVCVCALVIYCLLRRTYRPLLAVVPSVLMTAWYVYGRFVTIGNPEKTVLHDVPVPYMSPAFVVFKVNTFLKSLGYVNPIVHSHSLGLFVFGARGMYVLVAVTGVLAGTLMVAMARSLFLNFREQQPQKLLLLLFLLSVAAALLSPSEGLGVSDPGFRFMSLALALGIFVLRPGTRAFRLASGLSVVLGVSGLLMFQQLSFDPVKEPAATPHLSRSVAQFAHVEPESRAYYYDLLSTGALTKPVFGTSMLYNRSTAETAAAGGSPRSVAGRRFPVPLRIKIHH